jgi:hypothetical protein
MKSPSFFSSDYQVSKMSRRVVTLVGLSLLMAISTSSSAGRYRLPWNPKAPPGMRKQLNRLRITAENGTAKVRTWTRQLEGFKFPFFVHAPAKVVGVSQIGTVNRARKARRWAWVFGALALGTASVELTQYYPLIVDQVQQLLSGVQSRMLGPAEARVLIDTVEVIAPQVLDTIKHHPWALASGLNVYLSGIMGRRSKRLRDLADVHLMGKIITQRNSKLRRSISTDELKWLERTSTRLSAEADDAALNGDREALNGLAQTLRTISTNARKEITRHVKKKK